MWVTLISSPLRLSFLFDLRNVWRVCFVSGDDGAVAIVFEGRRRLAVDPFRMCKGRGLCYTPRGTDFFRLKESSPQGQGLEGRWPPYPVMLVPVWRASVCVVAMLMFAQSLTWVGAR